VKQLSSLVLIFGLTLLLAGESAAQEPPEPELPPGSFEITAEEVEAQEGPEGRVVILEGNVTIRQGGATIVGDHGIYRDTHGVALVHGNVHGVDGLTKIACDSLFYYQRSDVALLKGNASYADTSGVTRARRIEMFRRSGVAVCVGDVNAVDREGASELTAGRLVYDFDRREARASDGPVLVTFDDEGDPDATLTARVVEFSRSTGAVIAYGDAEIVRDDVTARARLVTIYAEDDRMVLEGSPSVERETDRLKGERILVFVDEGRISRVVATGRARTDYTIEDGDPAAEPQRGHVVGDTLTMFFQEGEPVLTAVRGRAASEHVVGDRGEMNRVDSRRIDVLFTEGSIMRAVFRGEARGSYTFEPEEGAAAGPKEGEAGAEEGAAAGPKEGEAGPEEGTAAGPKEGEAGPKEGEAGPEGGEAVPEDAPSPDELADEPDDGEAPVDAPADSVALEVVVYSSDRIDYYVGRNRIILSGGATVEYKETALTADEVVFDPEEQVLSASGSPDLHERGERLVGKNLNYDLEERSGTVIEGVTTFEDGLYYGERIHREEDGTLRVTGGVYTTCSDPEPHYRLESYRMKIYLDDKVVAKPVILYIGEIPVFALPFYVFPIRTKRHSGFLIPRVDIGVSQTSGRFIKNFGYYWAPSDYWDLTLWGDFYEQTRWITHAEARYKLRYVLSGSVSGSFMQEFSGDKRRWDLKLSHRQEFGRNWTMGASGDFRSDASYASDANQSIQESVNRSLHSQFWTRGRWSRVSVGVTLDRREEIDQDVVSELLPKIDVTGSQRPLVANAGGATGLKSWLAKTSYSWKAGAVNDRDRNGDETEIRQGVGVGASIRNSTKILRWINLTPRVSLRQNWYDRNKLGERFAGRFTYDAGVSAGTTVYGTFFPRVGPLEAVRHIIEPSASFSWTPDFTQYFNDDGTDIFYTMSGFGSTPREREALRLSLVNKLQLKVKDGGEIRKLDNLLRLSMSSSYDFTKDDHRWADLSSNLELRPGRALSVRWNTRHDTYDWDIENSTVTATIDLTGESPSDFADPWEDRIGDDGDSPVDELRREVARQSLSGRPGSRPWSASMTFRYSRGAQPGSETYWADGTFALSLTRNWRVNYRVHYDLKEQEVASQEYTLYRDLHCWEAQFTRRYYEGEWQYYFRINVKALPEIQAERGEKFLKRVVR